MHKCAHSYVTLPLCPTLGFSIFLYPCHVLVCRSHVLCPMSVAMFRKWYARLFCQDCRNSIWLGIHDRCIKHKFLILSIVLWAMLDFDLLLVTRIYTQLRVYHLVHICNKNSVLFTQRRKNITHSKTSWKLSLLIS